MPIDYSKYPSNWKTEIRPAIMKRADNCCEECGVRNHSVGYRKDGEFIGTQGNIIHDLAGQGLSYPSLEPIGYKAAKELADHCNEIQEERFFVIVLTVAHLDHDIINNDHSNLKALCQKCHLDYDKEHHRKNSKETLRKKKGLTDLFPETTKP